ncbi:MAG: ABC transporter ATP-binding protein [Chloroflexi bacterium]|nr:ABC transporter ATP-binding protein [Chloroflexota bacterium]
MARVRLAGITKHYGTTVAVQDFNLEVVEGEFVTLLGPSGCGKTTILRIIAGLVEPTSGQVYFDGVEITHLSSNARNIGFVFQTPALFPHLSIAQNIAFGPSVKGYPQAEIQARVQRLLAMVDLEGYGDRLPAQLSGGQQQRVSLARVLATDPRVLLFDEPLSALDRNLRETLKYHILELQRKTKKTAIYVTHDQSEAFAISDRIVVINAGRIEQIGTQTEIYLQPQSPFVAEFIGANNSLAGQVLEYSPEEARVAAEGFHLRCRSGLPLAPGEPVLVYIRPENIQLLTDGRSASHRNLWEGTVERVVFEGSAAQVHVNVKGRLFKVEVSGAQRLEVMELGKSPIWLGFDEVTLIPQKSPR